MDIGAKNNNLNDKGNLFIKDVTKYFMDFLETDFHKRKLPKRSVKFKNNDNLLIGVNLKKYKTFNKKIYELISKSFDEGVLNTIQKGVYKTNLPKNLIDLISLQIKKIKKKTINDIVSEISEVLEKNSVLYQKEYDIVLEYSMSSAYGILKSKLTRPLIENIDKPLQNLDLGDEDNIYMIEEELIAVFLRSIENKMSEIIRLIFSGEEIDIKKELISTLNIEDVREILRTFFEDLQVADLFSELFEMERNKNILDKQDFYLYFGDISFSGNKYPIFYIPFNLSRDGDSLYISFDAQVYINKKALEFIAQEHNTEKGTKGSLKNIADRIIYLSNTENSLLDVLGSVTNELSHFFELKEDIDFISGENKTSRGASVKISNDCYMCLFDKSDEALVNDYEDILHQLNQGGELSEMFNILIDDFIHKNPVSFNQEVEDEWYKTDTTEKLVYPSPIPLNSEQRQILSAVKKDDCKYIIVEGPPGTGKSHTITAITFDAILKNKSVLVLSDKKEALDVVEDKITETMNKVRFDKDFQNPILRLGKTGNTYNSILSKSTVDNIKKHYQAVRNDSENLGESIDKTVNTLKEDLEAEIISYKNININEIQEYFELELSFRDNELIFDFDELIEEENAVIELGDIKLSLEKIENILESKKIDNLIKVINLDKGRFKTLSDYVDFSNFLNIAIDSTEKIKNLFSDKEKSLSVFSLFNTSDLDKLKKNIEDYESLKKWPFGFVFSKKKVAELDVVFRKEFLNFERKNASENLEDLKNVLEIYEFSNELSKEVKSDKFKSFDYISFVHNYLSNQEFKNSFKEIGLLKENLEYIDNIVIKYPYTSEKIKMYPNDIGSIIINRLDEISENEFNRQIRYLNLRQKISKDFSRIPELNYSQKLKQIEDLVTTQVTYLLDGRLIDFYHNNKADAETLRNIIRSKQRFPKEEFGKLKEAFPCILAGIRDYAEYIPLEPEAFDLVIIDEASQVSISQAFPALLRAKKVLILGDKKQFSNVKSNQARSDTNREYLHNLERSFKDNISEDVTKVTRLKKFDIKTSILDFFNFINNYTIQLQKYFRGYKEIISYSNKYFYQDSLQVMKIRGKSVDDVIKFSNVEPSEEDEVYPNTNQKEVDFIIEELLKLKEGEKNSTVGIITPHTNQQKLLMEKITKIPEWDYFKDKFNLKIMTFDTCQGEERDIIFYSMVASKYNDKLWGVFIKDLSNVDVEEDGQIKAQRLNVGFSRAKECMHFVLSKNIDDFNGSIGGALRHYNLVLDDAKKEKDISETDSSSKMEPEVMNWFYQTKFWNENKDNIEFIPQFEIGKYLKQLDRSYDYPEYKVDFLMVYKDESHKENKIVIEYDGFREHFKDIDEVNEFNYERYYSPEDMYRQKVLEGYGYKFLRINKFNSGEKPVEVLDKRISS